jgi:RNA polymerase sigma factor (sigma-70 family)
VEGFLRSIIVARLRGGWTEGWIDDVVQESLWRVWRGLGGCRAETEGQVRSWIRAIAARQIATLLREEAGRQACGLEAVRGESEAWEPEGKLDERLLRILQELGRLPDSAHDLLRGRVILGESWEESGAGLGVPPTAAKRRWQRLQERLRSCALEGRPLDGVKAATRVRT